VDPWRHPPITFPSSSNALSSPDGQYVLKNVDSDFDEPAHSIYLVDVRTGHQRLLYSYGRWVNAVWSPSSRAVAINDFYAADDSRPLLFVLSPGFEEIDLWKQLERWGKSNGNTRKDPRGYPVFKYVSKWLTEDEFILTVIGFGGVGPNGYTQPFEYRYRYRLREGFLADAAVEE